MPPTMAGRETVSDANLFRIVRELLEDVGVLSSIEDVLSIFDMRAYVCGRCAR